MPVLAPQAECLVDLRFGERLVPVRRGEHQLCEQADLFAQGVVSYVRVPPAGGHCPDCKGERVRRAPVLAESLPRDRASGFEEPVRLHSLGHPEGSGRAGVRSRSATMALGSRVGHRPEPVSPDVDTMAKPRTRLKPTLERVCRLRLGPWPSGHCGAALPKYGLALGRSRTGSTLATKEAPRALLDRADEAETAAGLPQAGHRAARIGRWFGVVAAWGYASGGNGADGPAQRTCLRRPASTSMTSASVCSSPTFPAKTT